MKKFFGNFFTAFGVACAIWVFVSWGNAIANNTAESDFAKWNFFEIIYQIAKGANE